MSTHYIEEAERLADEVAVMTHGKVISRGKPAELIVEHVGRETAEVYAPPDRLAAVRAEAEAGGLRCARPARRSRSSAPSGPSNGAIPDDAVVRAASLEDVFVMLTGEEAESRSEAPRTGGDRRRDEPRAGQLPHLLAGDDLLQRARTDRLPARLRPRPQRDPGRRSQRRPLRAVRRHRHGRHRGDLLQRPAGDVRHLRQAPLPEHLRSDPRRPGRRRGAGQRRDALDRRCAPASTAACRCW